MSVKLMSWVWDTSPSEGVELLIELVLADFSDDSGKSWPSKKKVALKSRCSERYVQETVHKLATMNPPRIKIYEGAGPKGTNVYVLQRGENTVLPEHRSRENHGAKGGELESIKGENPSSPDPSVDPSFDPLSVSKRARLQVKDFVPTPEQWSLYDKKFPGLVVEKELERFNDYQHARGHGYVDHHRAFMNWLRSPFQEREPSLLPSRRRGGQPSPGSVRAQFMERYVSAGGAK